MKKLLASVLVCVCVFLMTACSTPMKSSTKRQNNLNSSFTAKMNLSLEKFNAEGTITRLGDGRWEAEFESPNTLSGVKLVFEENIIKASYKGLDFSIPKSAVPVKAMLVNLIEAVDSSAREAELTGSEKEGLFCMEGSLEGGNYSLSLDSSGNIHTFEMPNNLLKIAFSEVSATVIPSSPAAEGTIVSTSEITTTVSETVTTAC